MTERRGYPPDLKDDQWELIEPLLLKWRASRAEGREPVTSLREVVNAVLYVARTGIARRTSRPPNTQRALYLQQPTDRPPKKTRPSCPRPRHAQKHPSKSNGTTAFLRQAREEGNVRTPGRPA